ncbi:hypothetical protein GR925_14760 [Streptomyces sp. HUCO-GS316]|uniref:Rv1733c family protein n=1 Tax=Streptomyces sp. HUCO-GS316 TaxID=2692198 RepID=UPI001369E2F3|nr:hypothetical protein [Streptomyces sp. HUCO-GS316]MXM64673.1 hypothetical protein [Streptomyces sp. HUCO-GS316]
MSPRDSPQACGPHPAREEQTPDGANPLRRTSARVEAWCSRFQLVMLVLGLPAASVSAGLAAYGSAMRTVEARSAQRHRVTARLTSASESAPGGAADENQKVQVSWTGGGGRQQTGTVRVPLDKAVGSTARIWVDREGSVQDPPMFAGDAKANGWLMGGMTAVGMCSGFVVARKGMSPALDRRRYAQWDGEWEPAEPLWSARFHR